MVVTALLGAQVAVYYLYALRCSFPTPHQQRASDSEVHVLVMSDMHLLGHRRRPRSQRVWVDWQMFMSIRAALDVHLPDMVLVLGDQFDEGGLPTPQDTWNVGNHDTSFGWYMSAEEIRRFEVDFGASNRVTEALGHTFVQLNTMALDTNVQDDDVKDSAQSNTTKLGMTRTRGSVVLMTHLPLYRADDMQCGDKRRNEGGHITYEHPSFPYEIHHHVLSPELTQELLTKLRPSIILSGHTHAWCEYQPSGEVNAKEFTIPTFSWGQRPDPSYALLTLSGTASAVALCHLPHEHHVFAFYAIIGVMLLTLLVTNMWKQRHRWSRKHADLKLN
ncbi:TPA: hypothetical protein N0F65_002317 [Lagenidium giganteum]|uniref:Calcineurin-like phosphoesterase domain-containing protein n=1 Tax=Lagenidium giganteum TaxID=4803 RepID=A0AAV2Z6W3_9STRA|nr:TPA: hypothetical protein N0F65_002317 [Lagenidium giganteum]